MEMFSQLPGVRSAGVSAEDVGSAQDKFKVSLYHGVRRILQNKKTFNKYSCDVSMWKIPRCFTFKADVGQQGSDAGLTKPIALDMLVPWSPSKM